MTELFIAIHEAVAPFNQIFYVLSSLAAASFLIWTIMLNIKGE